MTTAMPPPQAAFAVAPLTLNAAARHLDSVSDHLAAVAARLGGARAELLSNWTQVFRLNPALAQQLRQEISEAQKQLRAARRLATHYELAANLRIVSDKYTSSESRRRQAFAQADKIGDVVFSFPVLLAMGPVGVSMSTMRGIMDTVVNSPQQPVVVAAVRGTIQGDLDPTDGDSWIRYAVAKGHVQSLMDDLADGLSTQLLINRFAATEAGHTQRPLARWGVGRTAQGLSGLRPLIYPAPEPEVDPSPVGAGEVKVAPISQWANHSGAHSLSELLGDIARLDPAISGEYGLVEIRQHVGMEGTSRWTVLIPGTQEQSLGVTDRAWDNASNLALVTGDISAASAQVVLQAMEQAGIGPQDPVLLVGHSQGGLIAASLGGSAVVAEKFNIASVVTAGAPVGAAVPENQVPQLHLEHDADHILALDGADNPVLTERTTVHRELLNSTLPVDQKPHSIGAYQLTARTFTGSGHPEAEQWLSVNAWALDSNRATYVRHFQGSR